MSFPTIEFINHGQLIKVQGHWNIISKEAIFLSSKTTSLVVTGLGTAVTALGYFKKGTIGAGMAGFGLAHVVLGILDMFRPSVQN